ncbi:MAG: hypothetical protein OSB00_10700 [Sphingomonas bacterium]|nr:hypothetical protein [Sphingomonas bacterium]
MTINGNDDDQVGGRNGGRQAEGAGAGVKKRVRNPDNGWQRWTAQMKDAFLDHLAATCNVCHSAAAAGVEAHAVYALRRRDPSFAAAWGEALAQGYVMLETLLVGQAMLGGGQSIEHGSAAIGPIDRELALKMMTIHQHRLSGKTAQGRAPRRIATREETDAVIKQRLKAIAAARKRAGAKATGAEPAGAEATGAKAAEPGA